MQDNNSSGGLKMLKVEGLSKSYGGETLFKDISFQLGRKERCSLVGRNGSGKSTLLKILIGELSPDGGTITLPKFYRLGYLQQHIGFSLPTLREEAALALPIEERETPFKVEAILSGLGFLKADFDKSPHSFSGGYQLRIQLAKTLAQEPECLLLDEPTNYLDVVSTRWLIQFLRAWKGEMIVISHDRSFLDQVGTHTMGLHRRQLFRVEGQSQAFYDSLLQVEEVHEKTRIRIEKQKEHLDSYIKRFGAKASKAKQAQSRKKAIERLPSLEKLAQIEELDFSFHSAPFPGKQMVSIDRLEFRYPGMNEPLIHEFSFAIEPGDRIGVVGKNGRGKSTLLRLLSGELLPEKGSIKRSENLLIGYFGQTNIAKLHPDLSVEEEIAQSNRTLNQSEIKRICGILMFSQKHSEKKIRILSGGEKSRVLLGKILASECNLLLLDEPTNHLDIESIEALLEALEEFEGSVVMVSHGEEILRRTADKLIVCRSTGQHLFRGGYEYFLEKEGWEPLEQKAKPPQSKPNRQEEKKQRAEKVQERSRALAPLKTAIDTIEKEIAKQEKLLTELQQSLTQGSPLLSEASRKIGLLQKEIDDLYQRLETLYVDYETIRISFET